MGSKDSGYVDVILNPITGKYASLTKPRQNIYSCSYLGFDPIDKKFKVLSKAYPLCFNWDPHRILTLGAGKHRWRSKINFPGYKFGFFKRICINGVLFHLAKTDYEIHIVCFDVRSEKFKFIDTGSHHALSGKFVNYKGKLGVISLNFDKADNTAELRMWVLEDVENPKWSKHVYTWPKHAPVNPYYVSIAGVTATGDIILTMDNFYPNSPFYVLYFNPERSTLQSVEIQGLGNSGAVYAFIDHVEDLNANEPLKFCSISEEGASDN
ncbi:hypothetical protein EUTSA_v10009630mg [Eutrema salsugineum]|uniref:F-box associated beta-propeller type 3 domain-containing protein n=1 Tax=Eutrema salsugineum TaxID=72664 RepID=V4KU53_EUTSA|nr:hypothetical protein EUTSA_v10009630mg [Eutrema salsugineum]